MAEDKKNIGCGVFLVLVGLVLVAERMGWILLDAAWLLPGVLIAVGIVKVIDALR